MSRAQAPREAVPHELTLQPLPPNRSRAQSGTCATPPCSSSPPRAAPSSSTRFFIPASTRRRVSTPLTLYVQIQETFYSRATLPQLRLSRLTHDQALPQLPAGAGRRCLPGAPGLHQRSWARARRSPLSRDLIDRRNAAVKTAQQLFNAGRLQRSDVLPLQVLASLAQQNSSLATLTDQQSTLALSHRSGHRSSRRRAAQRHARGRRPRAARRAER